MIIGKRILGLLEQKDLTQRELAKLLGVTEVSVSRYISGKHAPTADILSKMAEVLNTTTDYLLGRTINDYAQQLAKMQDIRKRQTTSPSPSPAESFIENYEKLSDDDKEKVIKELFNRVLENNKKR